MADHVSYWFTFLRGSRLLRLLSLEAMLAGCIFLRALFISPPPVSQFVGTIIFRIHLPSYKVCSLVSWAIFLVVCLLTVFARKVLPDTAYITLNKEKTGVGPLFCSSSQFLWVNCSFTFTTVYLAYSFDPPPPALHEYLKLLTYFEGPRTFAMLTGRASLI